MATLGKRTRREEQKELRGLNKILDSLQQESGRLSSTDMVKLSKYLKKKAHRSVDIGYIRTLLFPERYSYDIPQPLTNLSYARFTDYQQATINTGGKAGSNGCGMLVWYPRVNVGPSLFFYPAADGSMPMNAPIALNASGELDQTKWRCGFAQNQAQYFTQTCLVAASLSLQYIGQLEVESGIFVGGHIYGTSINELVLDDIENSQNKVTTRLNDGVRFIYLPKDAQDYEFYPTDPSVKNSHNGGAANLGGEQTWQLKYGYAAPNLTLTGLDGTNLLMPSALTAIVSQAYMSNTNCVAIYWKGIVQGQDWLRVDVTRKFNGIPKPAWRDILEVSKPKRNYDARKTLDVVRDMGLSVPIAGHTLKQLDRVCDQIQAMIPNIGTVHAAGGFNQPIKSLTDFGQMLEDAGGFGDETGNTGTMTGGVDRIYEFD